MPQITKGMIAFSIGLFCIVNCGCLLNHSHHVVLRQDEPLKGITFQSENARNAFETAVRHALDDDSDQSNASFGIPFIVGLEKSKSVSDTAKRNDVATLFDINQDRHISDYEASLRNQ